MHRFRCTTLILTLALAGFLAATGCGRSTQSASQPGALSTPSAPPGRPTASGIQSDIAKVNSDPNLTPAQREIMLKQMNSAQSMQSRPMGR